MKKDPLHVKRDEWTYPCTQAATRTKAKRARSKAKRSLSKKLLTKSLEQKDAESNPI